MTQSGWCVTANLQKGQAAGTEPWLRSALAQRPMLVFAQEFHRPAVVAAMADEHGYRVVWPARLEPRWWVVSWLLVRDDLHVDPVDEATQALLAPFSSYVAAARVHWPPTLSATVLSVHASPTVVTANGLELWPLEAPTPRVGGQGVRRSGCLLYADLLLAALAQLSSAGSVLAAGDLNEARAWDAHNPGHTWGREFFAAVSGAGLVDVTWELWGEERRTRFHPRDPGYQLDRVIASPDIAALVTRAHIDPLWTNENADHSQLSDHAPVWFELPGHSAQERGSDHVSRAPPH